MTMTEAKSSVAGRLQFGNAAQIEAVRFLADLERLAEIAKSEGWVRCPGCDGETYIPECGECDEDDQCEACAGGWLQACGLCNETGILDGDREPIPESLGDRRPALIVRIGNIAA